MPEGLVKVRAGDELDWRALAARLRACSLLPDEPLSVRQFTGGSANLTYLVSAGAVRLVVRRPPWGTIAPGAHDMAREHRVLSRLPNAYPRAPRALYFSDDASIVGAPFVVLEFRDGVVIRNKLPRAMSHHDDVARRLDLALLEATADLHRVDPTAVDLGSLGRPDGFARRQVTGWRDRWRRAAPAAGVSVMDEVAKRLESTLPEPRRVSLVHNDLKLDNCQFQDSDPDRVTSVLDWDMATLGDPLFDLGLLLVSMASSPLWVLTASEAAARYEQISGVGVDRLDWYLAFATWRTAVVMQQLYNRSRDGDSTDERSASFGDAISTYAERARELLN